MFVRKKKNPSGVVSVQVIDKSLEKYKVVKTIGSSSDINKINDLYLQGKIWIKKRLGLKDIFELSDSQKQEEECFTNDLLSNIENIILNGDELILNHVFRKVGFNVIEDDIFRQLVIARLSQPMSKSATVSYLKSHFNQDVHLHQIYRYLDKLYNTQQEKIQQISVEHTKKLLGGNIGVMFYDVTTLYFETDNSDELREKGFSKDGKHSNPQIVLGLLVSKEGYPLSYSIFNGAQYEGRTMIPLIDDFVSRFKITDFIVVADSGLMNKKNLSLLESTKYKYIIGARIKNENSSIKKWILSLEKLNGVFYETTKDNARLIISYSDKRAKKDKYNRDKGIKRLEKAYKSGRITKENINKRGYNKFLELSDDVNVCINRSKIDEDSQWDGLKGYLTNTNLPANEVYEQYRSLWNVERAFRITKGTIEIRPMFHFTPKRIEAHVCICFVAYKLYKELERILKKHNIRISVDNVLNIAKTVITITIKLPKSKKTISKTMFLTSEQKSIEKLFDDNFWKIV